MVKFVWAVLFLCVAALVLVAFLVVQSEPRVAVYEGMGLPDVERALAMLRASDPRRLEAGEFRNQVFAEADVELLINYGLSRLGGGGANAELRDGEAALLVTQVLPENPLGPYLNVEVVLSQHANSIGVESLRLGALAVPGRIAEELRRLTHAQLLRIPEYAAALEAVNGFQFGEGRVSLRYQWRPELVKQIRDRGKQALLTEADQERLLAYHRQLAELTRNYGRGDKVALLELLGPLFRFAQIREGDAVAENRALLLALSFYVSGVDVPRMLGTPVTFEPPQALELKVQERHDFAQHLMTSAALTLSAGQSLADTVGLFKELKDSDGGSGFSFTDLGADRSGVRLAEAATRNQTEAARVQALFATGAEEADFIPELRDLPEFMPADEFKQRFGGVGTPAYEMVAADIENRIARCRLHAQGEPD